MPHLTNSLPSPDWTFLSNHAHVLYCIAFSPDIRIRDIALRVRITERAVQRIVVDLEQGGYLKRERVGRQNRYRLGSGGHLRHPLEQHVEVMRLLNVLQPGDTIPALPIRKSRGAAARPTRAQTSTRAHVKATAASRPQAKRTKSP